MGLSVNVVGNQPTKESELAAAMNRISGTVNILHKRAEEITVKLEPVLAVVPAPTNGESPCEPPSSVPIIGQINAETEKLRVIVGMLEDISTRLPM